MPCSGIKGCSARPAAASSRPSLPKKLLEACFMEPNTTHGCIRVWLGVVLGSMIVEMPRPQVASSLTLAPRTSLLPFTLPDMLDPDSEGLQPQPNQMLSHKSQSCWAFCRERLVCKIRSYFRTMAGPWHFGPQLANQ